MSNYRELKEVFKSLVLIQKSEALWVSAVGYEYGSFFYW